eukprot:TRINITY_DN1263_c0_g1_i1.p1 TRINITY_DN1263_c0_g1~~TRINITY_DN1263_c0_g1_i1.p1  ORF type:complete len:382 (-),score=11.14 TRINITY_DN1263_c0_g1_i1:1260-2405(-)
MESMLSIFTCSVWLIPGCGLKHLGRPKQFTSMKPFLVAVSVILLTLPHTEAAKTVLLGGGATTVEKLYGAIIPGLNRKNGVAISYNPIGSSSGKAAIISDDLRFCSTDVPFSVSEEASLGAAKVTLPLALQTVSIFTYIPGFNAIEIRLTPKLVAQIFLRIITTWADSRIHALNPKLSVPSKQSIFVVQHSDNSGLTEIFSQWLTLTATSDWPSGVSELLSRAPGTISAKGSAGVAAAMRSNPFSIGYLSSNIGHDMGLNEVSIPNKAGNYLTSVLSNPYAAVPSTVPAATASWAKVSLVNDGAKIAWPLTSFTYVVARKSQVASRKSGALLKSFLRYVMSSAGQGYTMTYNFCPLPTYLLTQNRAAIETILLAPGLQPPF